MMFKSILVPIDVDQESSWLRPLPLAARMAKDYGAELHVVTVVPKFGMSIVGGYFPPDFEKKAIVAARAKLSDIVQQVHKDEVAVEVHVGHGTIYEEILEMAKRIGSDVLVMASHRPELKDYLIGPNAARVMRHATQSVFVVRD